MRELKFPKYDFRIKRENDQAFIFDEIRKKWLLLTPEEWVRQHVIFFLVDQKRYPPSLISVEKAIRINSVYRRFDLICYSNEVKPLLIVECKAPEVNISESTLDQVLQYNFKAQAPYILITNGLTSFCGKVDPQNASISYLSDIPEYNEY